MTGALMIAPATGVQDCSALRSLVQAHIEFERSAVTMPMEWEHAAAKLIGAGALTILIARVRGDAVGYAAMTTDVATWTAETFAHLDCLFVQQEYRGAQIGQQLMDAVITECRNRGCREIQWQTPQWNTSAIRFYERLGATHTAKARFRLALEPEAALL